MVKNFENYSTRFLFKTVLTSLYFRFHHVHLAITPSKIVEVIEIFTNH